MNSGFEIVRDGVSSSSPTTGELLIEGEHFCFTLEDPWLDNLRGQSCIPTGTYKVILSLSVRFGREMPRLIGVPNRSGILLHMGNDQEDTEGCILLGERKTEEYLFESKSAFNRFMDWFASIGDRSVVTVRNDMALV